MFPFYANYMQNLQKKNVSENESHNAIAQSKKQRKAYSKKCDIIQK